MEYEFRRNSLDGTVLAIFSMDHEVFGRWFSEELAENTHQLDELLTVIDRLQQGEINQYRVIGRDLTLEMDTEQTLVSANVLNYEESYELEDAMSLYDSESQSSCGLEDFQQVLLSWQLFLTEK